MLILMRFPAPRLCKTNKQGIILILRYLRCRLSFFLGNNGQNFYGDFQYVTAVTFRNGNM